MAEAKRGRPHTENPKNHIVRLRMDKDMLAVLDECAAKLDRTRSEVIREGIRRIYQDVNGEKVFK